MSLETAVRSVDSFESLLALLRAELGWPLPDRRDFDELTFGWSANELKVSESAAQRLQDGTVYQLRNFHPQQPWGIFLVIFNEPRISITSLRQVLRGLVPNRRQASHLPGWHHENLLFICTTRDYDRFTFAHFRGEKAQRAVLTTFGWDRGETAIRTLCEFNLKALHFPDDPKQDKKWLEEWRKAFDVEKVTKEFFKTYRQVFEHVESLVTGVEGETKRLFVQKLFNRLMFVRFLQKKGWLSFNGQRDYLRTLWEDHQVEQQKNAKANFYGDRLKPLFFLGLSTSNDVNLIGIGRGGFLKTLIGDVPYLNGGLFEEESDDKDQHIVVPDEAIEPILTELFYRFNFTVTESTPLNIEVAVDPEMLGKIFEELVTARHETGSYYTPKPVVAFMCQESLKCYLKEALPKESPGAIERFIDEHDPSRLIDPEATLEALKCVRVCDPACGSGAYLLGMLHELLDLRATLFAARNLDAKTVYERKLEIIQNNLYGVDIDPFAVNIARLRLWLSLVVDYEGEKPPPLPNLDFKIEVGDSLTAPDPSGGLMKDMFRKEQIERYYELKEQYLTAHHGAKRVLRAEIDRLRQQIRKWAHPNGEIQGFDWAVEFAEVFSSGGFDIVLANPPYVRADAQFKHIDDSDKRQAAIAQWKQYRNTLRESGIYQTLYEKWDLYLPFLERAYQLLRPNGRMVFIISDAYNAAKYARKSHEFFLKNARIERIDFCTEIPLFEAGINNTIVHFAKAAPQADHQPVRVRRWGESPDDFECKAEMLPTALQDESGAALFKPDGAKSLGMAAGFVPLEKICYISYGLRANADDRYWQGEFTTDDCLSPTKDRTHPKAFVQGKDLVKWWAQRVWYLEWGTGRAPHKFSRPTFTELHEAKEKLVAVRTPGATPKVIYDDDRLHFDASSIGFVPWHYLRGVVNRSISKTAKYRRQDPEGDREEREKISQQFQLKYVLAVMNSSFAQKWLSARRRSKIHIYPDEGIIRP